MNLKTPLAAVSALVVAAAVAGCSDNTHGDQQTLKLTQPGSAGSGGAIGNATGRSTPPGSGFAFSSPYQDTSGNDVGELDAICIATQPSPGTASTATAPARPPFPAARLR